MQECFVKDIKLNIKTIRMYYYDDYLIITIWLNRCRSSKKTVNVDIVQQFISLILMLLKDVTYI